ncbi:MAG: proline dehydrogenase family protein [Vulcanimicrobiaceae bacterium]
MTKHLFFLAKRFVAGESIGSALEAVSRLNAAGMSATLDFLGEDVLERDAARQTRDTYLAMLDAMRAAGVDANVSVKLTAMGLLVDTDFALSNLVAILERATHNHDPFVRVDMEGSSVTARTLELVEAAYASHPNVGIVLQAYLKRTDNDIERAIARNMRVRLCKGAYNEPATIAYKKMPVIREHFLANAQRLLEHGRYPGIATHDRALIAAIEQFVTRRSIGADRFEFQMLYGCRPQLQRELVAKGYRVRVYVPFGTHWAGYFYRRVLERRENALFAVSSIFSK